MLRRQWLVNAARLPRQWLVNATASEIKQMSVIHLRKLCTLGNLPNFYNWQFFCLRGREFQRQVFCLTGCSHFVAISQQAVHGNQPGDPWKSTPGPRWLPTFLLRLPHDCPPLTKTTHRNYHSTLSVQIIRSPNYPHLPPKLSLISASLVNSHILQHFPARSIFAQEPNKHKIRAGSTKIQ